MAQGGTARRETTYARQLNTLRLQDLRSSSAANDADGFGEAPNDDDRFANLSDSSDLSETQASPIELPEQSYTSRRTANDTDEFGDAENDNDMPSTVMELERQRAKDKKMRDTAEQFTGQPSIPQIGPTGAPNAGPSRQSGGKRRSPEAEDEETSEAEEPQMSREMMERQLRDAFKGQSRSSTSTGSSQAPVQAGQKHGLSAVKKGAGLTGLGLLVTFLIMNVQLINEMSFNNKNIPKLSFIEKTLTIFLDIFLFIFAFLLLAFTVSVVVGVLTKFAGLFGLA